MSSPSDRQETPDFGPPLRQRGLVVRAAAPNEVPALIAMRARAFRGGGTDEDAFDARCLHLWVGEDGAVPATPLATARMQLHRAGEVAQGYTARYFDLTPLAAAPGPALELGRLCTRPGPAAPLALRMIWAGVARMVERTGAARLIGCSSFPGTDPADHATVLAHLAAHHRGPDGRRPQARPDVEHRPLTAWAEQAGPETVTPAQLPTLLRSYLSLGGWLGADLVIDRDLGTCVAFTCVEIATMPPRRRRVLTALAG
ncbi:MAG: ornithine-acyl[acyl carrier protein] N-acyltransferase [Rhodobacteraceae bacterium HLUCCA12]|nr:MAG: ornithine-acyl[acyl carrier protein] N-acyltransferase [Rhodobacteraceae bacterium HLUCCA12]